MIWCGPVWTGAPAQGHVGSYFPAEGPDCPGALAYDNRHDSSVPLSLCLSACLPPSVCKCVCVCVCVCLSLSLPPSHSCACVSISLSLSACLSVCLAPL